MLTSIRFSLLILMLPSLAVAITPNDYQNAAMSRPGDVANGLKIYRDEARAKCVVCHQVEGTGGKVGPDLSKIGGKFDRIHLIESLLHPSAQIVEGYQTSTILTADSEVIAGIIKEEDQQFVSLLLPTGQKRTIARRDIDAIEPSKVSIMPADLATNLSVDEFVDLVAYLATLRSGQDGGFGGGISGPIGVADGLKIQTVATGLDAAVALETLPDGRVLVCEQRGTLRVIKDGQLLSEPMITIDVEDNWERGFIGVTVADDFEEDPWVYVCYVVREPFTHHVIARYRVDGDVAIPASRQILLEGDDQELTGGFKKSGHQGGGMHFGLDGCLYVGLGEQTAKTPAQDLSALQGKILRIGRDGSIPADNPFVDQTTGKYQSIWAMGCRNPFSFAIDRRTGRMLINDVGGKFEEINVGRPGANFGWPVVDHGPPSVNCRPFDYPIHYYPEASVSGGDFAPPTAPAFLRGRYVFGDFVHGWIHSLNPDLIGTTAASTDRGVPAAEVATGLRRLCDLRFAADGDLYALLRNAWILDDKLEPATGSVVRIYSE